jgi:hypothetical protein
MRRSPRFRAAALVPCLLVLVAAVAPAIARADVSEAVQKKLKGKLYLSDQPFPLEGGPDADAIHAIEKHARRRLTAAAVEGVATWRIAFVAFLGKKPGVTELSVDFTTDDKDKQFAAQKRLAGVSADVPLLAGEFEITEDDGLARGKAYRVDVVARSKGKDVVLATGKLRLE